MQTWYKIGVSELAAFINEIINFQSLTILRPGNYPMCSSLKLTLNYSVKFLTKLDLSIKSGHKKYDFIDDEKRGFLISEEIQK